MTTRLKISLRIALTAALAGGTAAAFVSPPIAALIALAAVSVPALEALLVPAAPSPDHTPLAAWQADAADDAKITVPFDDAAPPIPPPSKDPAADLVAHLPELLSILDNLGRRAVQTSNEASQKFITQLVAIEDSINAGKRSQLAALADLEELDRQQEEHAEEQEAFGISIDAAVAFNNTISQEISASRGALTEVGHSIDDLRKEVFQIGKIAKEIDILSINAGIAAARAGQAGAGFTVIATSIRELASQTYNLTSRMEPLIKTAWDTIATYASQQVHDDGGEQTEPVERLGQQGILLEVLRIKLSQMADEHATLLRKNRQQIDAARARGADFENSIHGALASAQFGDIIRQQIETILNSLTSVREMAEAADGLSASGTSASGLISDLAESYVMDSQREAHEGDGRRSAGAGNAIDLF